MPAPLDRKRLETIATRVGALETGARARWGNMAPVEAVAHLAAAVRLSLGEIELPDESTALFRNRVVQWLLMGPLPWPKGKIEAPEGFRPPPASDLETERAALRAAMERFVDTLDREPQRSAVHPAFGALTLRKWSRLHGKHFDHHLRQFSV